MIRYWPGSKSFTLAGNSSILVTSPNSQVIGFTLKSAVVAPEDGGVSGLRARLIADFERISSSVGSKERHAPSAATARRRITAADTTIF
jgi:hypothetical protein